MDPREGDIAEDGAGNFLVYRGGNWYPSNENGYPLERIPRADYGERYYQQPNGDIVREGPRGGFEVIERADGGAGGGAATTVGADARGRYQIGADPLVAAARSAAAEEARGGNPLNRDWGAVVLGGIDLDPREGSSLRPFAPLARLWGGQDYQNYDQALATYEASLLPIQSGANVTESEARRQIRADFPQLGDSEETVRRKAQNRLRRINAVFLGIGREPPFTEAQIADPTSIAVGDEIAVLQSLGGASGRVGPIDPETGTPTYPTINALTANVQDYGFPVGSGPSTPSGPGSSQDNPFVLEGANSADVYNALKDGGWVQGPDGRVYELPPGVVQFAAPEQGDVEVSPGVFQRAQTPQEEVSERGRMNGILRRIDAFVRGAADTATFGLADEIAAGAETVLPLTGGASGWSEGFGDAYRQNLARERAIDRADVQDVPVSRGAGQVTGALGAPGAVAGARFISRAPNMGYAMTRSAAVGGVGGGLYGAGAAEGGLPERAQGLMTGGAFGAGVGGVLPPVGRAAAAVAAPVVRPIGQGFADLARAATGRGLTRDERAARSLLRGQNPEAMRAAAAEMRGFGAEPTVADVAGSVVQGRTRVAATRQTPGRAMAEDFAAGRRSDIQDYTAGLGRIVSEAEATPSQIEGMLEQYQRQASGPQFAAARASGAVDVSPDVSLALYSPEGRQAMQQASRLYSASSNPDERALAAELESLATARPRQGQSITMSVGAADLLSRHLLKAGGTDQNVKRVFGTLGRSIRDQAAEQAPAYREALTGFAERARLGDAAEIGARFAGRGSARDFASGVQMMGDDGRQIARLAARSGIEQAAETPRGAMTMLDRLAVGRGQQQRAQALLAPDEAATLQRGAQVGRQLVATAQNVNPRAGSNTFLNFADEGAPSAGIVGNVMRGRFLSAAGGALDVIRGAGISDDQAERIVALALDPARTDEAIEILSTRLAPGVAQRTVAALRQAANPVISTRVGGEQGRQVSMTNPGF